MHNLDWALHNALRDVVRANVPRTPTTAPAIEHRLLALIAHRARQLQRTGLSREEITARVLEELAAPEPHPPTASRLPDSFRQVIRTLAARLRA